MSQLDEILDELIYHFEGAIQVPDSPQIDRQKEDIAEAKAKAAILSLALSCVPEKRTATMVLGCPYCKRNFPIIEEEWDKAITQTAANLRKKMQ